MTTYTIIIKQNGNTIKTVENISGSKAIQVINQYSYEFPEDDYEILCNDVVVQSKYFENTQYYNEQGWL
jgi:hypothetical protein